MTIRIREVQRTFSAEMAGKADTPQVFPALLGDGVGSVAVPGRPGWVYVRIGSDLTRGQAFNVRVPNRDNLPVLVGYDPISPRLFQVLSLRHVYTVGGAGYTVIAQAGPHHETHEWAGVDGSDVVYVHARQWLPLRVRIVSGFLMQVDGGPIYRAGAWRQIATQQLDLEAYKPALGARWVLLYLDAAGTLAARAGGNIAAGDLNYANIPAPEADEFPLAGVRLYGGQTAILDTYTSSDVVDLRWPQTNAAAPMHDPVTLSDDADQVLDLEDQEITLDDQEANTVFAGPTDGADAPPDFRALVENDLPEHSHVEADITDLDHDAEKIQGRVVSSAAPDDDDVLVWDSVASEWVPGVGGGGAAAFTDLTDVPASYVDHAGELTRVNDLENALEFVDLSTLAGSLSEFFGGGGSNPSFQVPGTLVVATDVAAYVAASALTIEAVYIYCKEPGSAGSTIVDVHLNGTTIFTTQGNRPTLAYDDADQVAKSGAPDTTSVDEADVLTIDIDQVATGSSDLTVVIAFTGSGGGGGGGGSNPVFYVPGALVEASGVGAYIAASELTIEAVYIYCRDPGSAGSTIVDVHLNGVTIFTEQDNRPMLAYDDADQVAKSGAPDVTDVVENDVLTIDIDQAATDASDLTVVIAFVGGESGDASEITYTPAVEADWNGGVDPGNVDDALDQLADRIDDLEGGGGGGGNSTYTNTVANRPAASNDGDLFLPSNGVVIERDTGAAWAPWGPIFPLSPVPTTGWSWVNQGGATVDTTYGGIYLTVPATASQNTRLYVRSAPSTPYTITALVQLRMAFTGANDYIEAGLSFRQSSNGRLATFGLQQVGTGTYWSFILAKLNSETSWNSNYTADWLSRFSSHPIWFRIADNGTNRVCSWSMDGQHWIQVHSVGRTDFLTADQVGIFASANHATLSMSIMVYSWKEA